MKDCFVAICLCVVSALSFLSCQTSETSSQEAFHLAPAPKLAEGQREPMMLRFWRGYKQDQVKDQVFIKNINDRLIPETVAVGEKRGLMAYIPILMPTDAPAFIPSEVALISYLSKRHYDAIRATPRGAKYGPLHFEEGMFAKKNKNGFESKSTVAEPYDRTAKLQLNSSVILGSPFHDWQKHPVGFFVLTGVDKNLNQVRMLLEYLEVNRQDLAFASVIVTIDANYVMVLVGWTPEKAGVDVLPLPQDSTLKTMFATSVPFSSWDQMRIAAGEGKNIQFDREITLRD